MNHHHPSTEIGSPPHTRHFHTLLNGLRCDLYSECIYQIDTSFNTQGLPSHAVAQNHEHETYDTND
jgi:hypothetical protein